MRCGVNGSKLLIPAVTLLACGCAAVRDYGGEMAGVQSRYRSGDAGGAARMASALAARHGGGQSGVLYQLEAGALARAAGDVAGSNGAFAAAEARIEAYDGRAVVSARDLGGAAAAVVANRNLAPYRGYGYDRIMLHGYKALNFLELGEVDAARVELRRAYERQQAVVAAHGREIARAKRELERRGGDWGGLPVGAASPVGSDALPVYADYVNPLVVWLDGVVHLAGRGTDLERARKSLRRVAGMLGEEGAAMVGEDVAEAERRIGGRVARPTVWVLMESGLGPRRRESRIDLPVPTGNGLVHVGVAVPQLVFQPDAQAVRVAAPGEEAGGVLLASMDAVVAQEFEHQQRLLLAHSALSLTAKAAAQVALRREFGDAGAVGGALLSMWTTRADLRTWMALPKTFRLVRLARPANGRVTVTAGGEVREIRLPDDVYVLVLVKTVAGRLVRAGAVGLR